MVTYINTIFTQMSIPLTFFFHKVFQGVCLCLGRNSKACTTSIQNSFRWSLELSQWNGETLKWKCVIGSNGTSKVSSMRL